MQEHLDTKDSKVKTLPLVYFVPLVFNSPPWVNAALRQPRIVAAGNAVGLKDV